MKQRSERDYVSTSGEGGYALAGLLALMAVMALALIAAAPNLQKQEQRERELDAISRGEHLAEAIGDFTRCRNRPPTSLEELVKQGCPAGRAKNRNLVRQSDLIDPLTPHDEGDDSNWRLVAPNSREIVNFSRAIASFAGGQTPKHNLYPIMNQ